MKRLILLVLTLIFLHGTSFAYTGLIIDAHGLEVYPTMSPMVYDTIGREIYGKMNVDPDIVITHGIVGYTYSIEEAMQEIAGEHPLIVRAVARGPDPKRADLIVLKEDGDQILKENFEKNLRVAIIL